MIVLFTNLRKGIPDRNTFQPYQILICIPFFILQYEIKDWEIGRTSEQQKIRTSDTRGVYPRRKAIEAGWLPPPSSHTEDDIITDKCVRSTAV